MMVEINNAEVRMSPTHKLNLTLSDDMHAELTRLSKDTGVPMAHIVRNGAAREIKAMGGKLAKGDVHPPRRGGRRAGAGRPAND